MLVLQYNTAPASNNTSTKAEFSVLGLKHRAARPMEVSKPRILNVSLREMGMPWRGPRGGLPESRCESRRAARERAGWKRISVRQVVSWWDIAARLGMC